MATGRSAHMCVVLLVLLGGAGLSWADPMGTTFTYQGQLKCGGVPCYDLYDMMFRLFDSPTSETAIGEVVVKVIPVVNGLFSVNVDVDALYTGGARWIEVQVKESVDITWTVLSPRQEVHPVPYAMCASSVVADSVNNLGLANDGDSLNKVSGGLMYSVPATPFVGVGRDHYVTADEYFGLLAPTDGWGGMFVQTSGSSGLPFYGYAAGGNLAYTWMNGSTNDWGVYNSGYHLTVKANGNVGIGTASPMSPLQVTGDYDGEPYSGVITGVNTTTDTSIDYTHVGVAGTCMQSANGTGVQGVGGVRGVAGYVYTGGYGVWGDAYGPASAISMGVTGRATGLGANYGVYGFAGGGTANYAGYFQGNVTVTGTLSKAGGSFKIDDPIDPQHKYLYHSFVESPDMKNIYDGVVTTDAKGYATVTLPDWFDALNKDFRYQLTCIGQFAQAIVAQEVQNNQFVIQTDKPDVKVSWQVTGIRQDAWANANRIPVEEVKPEAEQGKYLHPEAFGKPAAAGIAPAPQAIKGK